MKLTGFRIGLLAMTAPAAPPAFAAQATPSTHTVSHPQQSTPADRNRDGRISRAEQAIWLEARKR